MPLIDPSATANAYRPLQLVCGMQVFIDAPASMIEATSKYMRGFRETPVASLLMPLRNISEVSDNIIVAMIKPISVR